MSCCTEFLHTKGPTAKGERKDLEKFEWIVGVLRRSSTTHFLALALSTSAGLVFHVAVRRATMRLCDFATLRLYLDT